MYSGDSTKWCIVSFPLLFETNLKIRLLYPAFPDFFFDKMRYVVLSLMLGYLICIEVHHLYRTKTKMSHALVIKITAFLSCICMYSSFLSFFSSSHIWFSFNFVAFGWSFWLQRNLLAVCFYAYYARVAFLCDSCIGTWNLVCCIVFVRTLFIWIKDRCYYEAKWFTCCQSLNCVNILICAVLDMLDVDVF